MKSFGKVAWKSDDLFALELDERQAGRVAKFIKGVKEAGGGRVLFHFDDEGSILTMAQEYDDSLLLREVL